MKNIHVIFFGLSAFLAFLTAADALHLARAAEDSGLETIRQNIEETENTLLGDPAAFTLDTAIELKDLKEEIEKNNHRALSELVIGFSYILSEHYFAAYEKIASANNNAYAVDFARGALPFSIEYVLELLKPYSKADVKPNLLDEFCDACDGSGYKICTVCKGTGKVGERQQRTRDQQPGESYTCTNCRGHGVTICAKCAGSGRLKRDNGNLPAPPPGLTSPSFIQSAAKFITAASLVNQGQADISSSRSRKNIPEIKK